MFLALYIASALACTLTMLNSGAPTKFQEQVALTICLFLSIFGWSGILITIIQYWSQ